MIVAALNIVQVLSWRDLGFRWESDFLAAVSSIGEGLKWRNPADRIVLSWPLVPQGYLGKPSADFDDDQ